MRFGFLSVAHMHAWGYAGGIRRLPGCEFVGVADEDEGRGRKFAADFETRRFDSYEALLDEPIDSVIVTSENARHRQLTEMAAARKKHVLCEKPFARDAGEARRMLEAAEAAGIVHMMGTEFRYSTTQALATRAVRAGVIGEPRLATFILNVPVLADPAGEVPNWWSSANQGGGWLGAFGSQGSQLTISSSSSARWFGFSGSSRWCTRPAS